MCDFWVESDTAIGTPTLWELSNALKITVTVTLWSWLCGGKLLN